MIQDIMSVFSIIWDLKEIATKVKIRPSRYTVPNLIMENFASFYYLQTLLIIDSKQDNDINSSILQATCTCIKKGGSNYNLHCEI